MPNIDLSDLIPQHTLTLTVPDRFGQKHTWEVPPFDNETEHFYWQWQRTLMAHRQQEQQAAMGMLEGDASDMSDDTMAEIWAPLLAATVKTPRLEAEDLVKDFFGVVLARAGGAVMSFFLVGEVGEEEPLPTPMPKPRQKPSRGKTSSGPTAV